MKFSSKIIIISFLFFISCNNNNEPREKPTVNQVLSAGKWIDLTYSFSKETLYWPNNPTGFQLDTQFNGMTETGFYYSSYVFCSPEHGGTHLDAPVHFAEGKQSADSIPLENLIGNAVVIDVSEKALKEPDYLISIADVTEWEKQNHQVPPQSIILFRTGYGQFYPDAKKYFGTDGKGDTAIANLHFPGIDEALAKWLVQERKPKAVGLDTPSIDHGQSKDFKTHQALLAENIPGFENVANLDKLPATGAYVFALPMKIKNVSGGPLRIIAWVSN
jgi:kynurenine formamidase